MKNQTIKNEPQLSAEMRKHCMCERCKDGVIHFAHCAVHNMPAEPNGECDCNPETPAFSEDLSYYWQRILGEDWTNNQPLYELYLCVVKELATALNEQREKYIEQVKKLKKPESHEIYCGCDGECFASCDASYNKALYDIKAILGGEK
jgi:hypothetical protein